MVTAKRFELFPLRNHLLELAMPHIVTSHSGWTQGEVADVCIL